MRENLKNKWMKRNITVTTLANIALFFSVVAARRNCMYVFHQPKQPKGLEKYKRR